MALLLKCLRSAINEARPYSSQKGEAVIDRGSVRKGTAVWGHSDLDVVFCLRPGDYLTVLDKQRIKASALRKLRKAGHAFVVKEGSSKVISLECRVPRDTAEQDSAEQQPTPWGVLDVDIVATCSEVKGPGGASTGELVCKDPGHETVKWWEQRPTHRRLVCLLKEMQHCYELPSRDSRRDSSWFGPLEPAEQQSQVSGGTLEAAVKLVLQGAQPKLPFGAGLQMLFESFGAWHALGAVPDVLQHGGSEQLVAGSWWKALQHVWRLHAGGHDMRQPSPGMPAAQQQEQRQQEQEQLQHQLSRKPSGNSKAGGVARAIGSNGTGSNSSSSTARALAPPQDKPTSTSSSGGVNEEPTRAAGAVRLHMQHSRADGSSTSCQLEGSSAAQVKELMAAMQQLMMGMGP